MQGIQFWKTEPRLDHKEQGDVPELIVVDITERGEGADVAFWRGAEAGVAAGRLQSAASRRSSVCLFELRSH